MKDGEEEGRMKAKEEGRRREREEDRRGGEREGGVGEHEGRKEEEWGGGLSY